MQLESKTPKNHILEILIPFLGVLAPYKIGIIPVRAILLLVIFLFRNGGKVRIPQIAMPYIVFVGYLVARDVLHMFFSDGGSVNAQINRLLEKIVLYLLIFFTCGDDFDEDVLFKWWRIAGIIFGAGMLYHVYQLLVLGQEVYPISFIPGYDIAHEAGEMSGRPCSLFSEPSAYVESMLPLLFLSLRKRKFFWAAISAFLIVVSTSTVGVVLTAVMWIVFILFERKSFKTTLLYIGFAVVFVVLFLNMQIFSDSLAKLQDVSSGNSTWGSRIEGPFQMISAMKWQELPFGTTTVNTIRFVYERIEHFSSESRPYIYAQENRDVYMNTYCNLIFRYGIVGLVLFLRIFKGKIFHEAYGARIFVITMLVGATAMGVVATPDIPMVMFLLYEGKMRRQQRLARITSEN